MLMNHNPWDNLVFVISSKKHQGKIELLQYISSMLMPLRHCFETFTLFGGAKFINTREIFIELH